VDLLLLLFEGAKNGFGGAERWPVTTGRSGVIFTAYDLFQLVDVEVYKRQLVKRWSL